jgi:O-antigen ligase
MIRLVGSASLPQRFLNLTLPPLSLNARLSQFLLIALVMAIGLAIARFPLAWVVLLLGGAIFLTLLLRKPILSLYVLIPIIPFSSLLAVSLGSFRVGLMEIVLALGLLTWLLQWLTHHTLNQASGKPMAFQTPTSAPLFWAFLLVLAGVSLSWLNALSLGASLIETAKWVETLALYLLVVALLPPRQIQWVVIVILLTGVAQAILGLYQFTFKVGPEGFLLFDGRFLRAYGTFAQPNPYAGYLGLVLPLALSLTVWKFSDGRWQIADSKGRIAEDELGHQSAIYNLLSTIFYPLSLGLMLVALFASQSRAAWLGFGVAAVVTLGLSSKKMAVILVVLALIGTIFGLAGSFDWGLINTSFVSQRFAEAISIAAISDIGAIEVNDANFATIERLAHWQAAREMWRDHPWLGVGFGNYAVVYPLYAVGRWLDPLGHAHNYLLNIGAEAGLVGITIYLIFWILTFRVSLLALKHRQSFYRAVVAGGIGILVHLQIHNFFDNLYVQGMYLHLAVVLALISIIYQCHQTKSIKESS